MGRARVQLKRIENKISRQVTFSKRRTGLLKKAHEISVLCDAEVALIVFSTKGKLFEYSTHSSMEAILERYERYSSAEPVPDGSEQQGNWALEHPKLTAKIEILERNLRNYNGDDLDILNLRELQHLEHQTDTALKRIRSRKNQLVYESISDLREKERSLQEQNHVLSGKLKENEDILAQENEQREQQNLLRLNPPFVPPPELMLPGPSLAIGGPFQGRGLMVENENAEHQTQPGATQLPAWMLRHTNG